MVLPVGERPSAIADRLSSQMAPGGPTVNVGGVHNHFGAGNDAPGIDRLIKGKYAGQIAAAIRNAIPT
jgi:hypothetical protein